MDSSDEIVVLSEAASASISTFLSTGPDSFSEFSTPNAMHVLMDWRRLALTI